MAETLAYLVKLQGEIAQARRLAAEFFDPETSRLLLRMADELERRGRELDAQPEEPPRAERVRSCGRL